MSRTKKIIHYAFELEAGEENRNAYKVCNDILQEVQDFLTMSANSYWSLTIFVNDIFFLIVNFSQEFSVERPFRNKILQDDNKITLNQKLTASHNFLNVRQGAK